MKESLDRLQTELRLREAELERLRARLARYEAADLAAKQAQLAALAKKVAGLEELAWQARGPRERNAGWRARLRQIERDLAVEEALLR